MEKQFLDEDMEYVLYVRRSSDEGTGRQLSSIPDQIEECIKYADNLNLKIAPKPSDFSDFETEKEIREENNEKVGNYREIYQSTRHLYIIKDSCSAKGDKERIKWNKLMRLMKSGKIKGVISYAPDRQSRNAIDSANVTSLASSGKVDFKYVSTPFDASIPNSIMMLELLFMLASNFSNNLSVTVKTRSMAKASIGNPVGIVKWGYDIKDGKYVPNPKTFPLMGKAFQMRLDGVSVLKIVKYLNSHGGVRKYKKSRKKMEKVSHSSLSTKFQDSFYYGMFEYAGELYDLRKLYGGEFTPLISEKEYRILEHRYKTNPSTKVCTKYREDLRCIRSFPNYFLITDDGYNFTFSLSNRKRFEDKIAQAIEKGEKASLLDFVEPHHIRYVCTNSNSKYKGLTLTQKQIDSYMVRILPEVNVTREQYDAYVWYCKNGLKKKQVQDEKMIIQTKRRISELETEKQEFIRNCMSRTMDKEESSVYNSERVKYDENIRLLKTELKQLQTEGRNEILEYSVFKNLLKKAKRYYKNSDYVRKGRFGILLFSNIKSNSKKRLTGEIKPHLVNLLCPKWYPLTGNYRVYTDTF